MTLNKKLSVDDLDNRAASSLAHVRKILDTALKDALKQLSESEKQFYGMKNAKAEISKRARMLKKLMKQVNLSWFTEPIHMDRLATRVFSHDEEDLAPVLKQVRDLYEKTWKFLPSQLQPIIDKIEKTLRFQQKYCLSVYNPGADPYIKTSNDYQKKIRLWTADVKKYLGHAKNLKDAFHRGVLYLDEMSQTTREMAMKLEAESCPFIFAFFEACEVLRESVRRLQEWLEFANEYTNFLQGEMDELLNSKTNLQQQVLKQQDKYNKENYRLVVLKQELDTQKEEQASLQSKEMELLVREELLMARIGEMKLDFDIKEFRLAEMQRTVNPKTAAQSILDTMSQLAEEVRVEGHELHNINKELALIKLKTAQIYEKQDTYKQTTENYAQLKEEVNEIHKSYLTISKEYNRLGHTIDHIKYLVQYLSTPDTAQSIFLDLPRRKEALSMSKAHGLNIASDADDMMDKVFDVLSKYLGTKWIQVYRDLPFYPARGQRTIEEDIRQIQNECVRDSLDKEVRKSLERWRRYHTRAKASDVLSVIKSLGDHDVLKAIDRIVNPPRPKTPAPEVFPTFLEESLIPYYQQVSRYDAFQQHKKTVPPAVR